MTPGGPRMKARRVLACVALATVAYPLGYVAALWLSYGLDRYRNQDPPCPHYCCHRRAT